MWITEYYGHAALNDLATFLHLHFMGLQILIVVTFSHNTFLKSANVTDPLQKGDFSSILCSLSIRRRNMTLDVSYRTSTEFTWIRYCNQLDEVRGGEPDELNSVDQGGMKNN